MIMTCNLEMQLRNWHSDNYSFKYLRYVSNRNGNIIAQFATQQDISIVISRWVGRFRLWQDDQIRIAFKKQMIEYQVDFPLSAGRIFFWANNFYWYLISSIKFDSFCCDMYMHGFVVALFSIYSLCVGCCYHDAQFLSFASARALC